MQLARGVSIKFSYSAATLHQVFVLVLGHTVPRATVKAGEEQKGLASSPRPPHFHISSAVQWSILRASAERAEGTSHSSAPHPCPWLPSATEGTQLSVHHWHRKIGARARSAGSSCAPCSIFPPKQRDQLPTVLAHHCHKGVGNRFTWDGAGSGECSTSLGRSAHGCQ